MQLRYYQRAAIDAARHYLQRHDGNPLIVIPTGGGKTPIMATISQMTAKNGGHVIIVSHVKELVEQTAQTLRRVDDTLSVGVYSAGLKSRDIRPVTVASIQSVYNKDLFDRIDLILIDEAHRIPPDGEGMYRTFINNIKIKNPHVRLIGLTATPYRTKSGFLCSDDGIFNDVCYEVGVKELINNGFLSRITCRGGQEHVDVQSVHVKMGEFVQDELEAIFDDTDIYNSAIQEVTEKAKDRKAILFFLTSVKQAKKFCDMYTAKTGEEIGLVTGETFSQDRDILIKRFKGELESDNLMGENLKPLRCLASIDVLTTGFDAPNIDCIVMLRPTASAGLYYQMVGRGFRICDGKDDCLVLDYATNIVRHGPVDAIEPGFKGKEPQKKKWRECPECHSFCSYGKEFCPECGFAFPHEEREFNSEKFNLKSDDNGILTGEKYDIEYDVISTEYYIHTKRDAEEGTPRTIRVDYNVTGGSRKKISEWLCVEHVGYPYQKFKRWWGCRVCPEFQPPEWEPPEKVEEFMFIADMGGIAEPSQITVRHVTGEKFPKIIDYKLKEIPTAQECYARHQNKLNNGYGYN